MKPIKISLERVLKEIIIKQNEKIQEQKNRGDSSSKKKAR